MDLVLEVQEKLEQLEKSIKSLRVTGSEFAEAERHYKILLRNEALKLRTDENLPVTLIQQVVYGIPEVADARYKRDVAETVYKANQEAINSIKLQLRILENQIQREFTSNVSNS